MVDHLTTYLQNNPGLNDSGFQRVRFLISIVVTTQRLMEWPGGKVKSTSSFVSFELQIPDADIPPLVHYNLKLILSNQHL